MKYHKNVGHALGQIQHIVPITRIKICSEACSLATENMAPNITGFRGLKSFIEYIWLVTLINPFYASNSYNFSIVIRLTLSWNQGEDYTN